MFSSFSAFFFFFNNPSKALWLSHLLFSCDWSLSGCIQLNLVSLQFTDFIVTVFHIFLKYLIHCTISIPSYHQHTISIPSQFITAKGFNDCSVILYWGYHYSTLRSDWFLITSRVKDDPDPKAHSKVYLLRPLLESVVPDWISKEAYSKIEIAWKRFLRSVLGSNVWGREGLEAE